MTVSTTSCSRAFQLPSWPSSLPSDSQNSRDEAANPAGKMNDDPAFAAYEHLVQPARVRFALSSGVQAIQASRDPAFLEAFLFYFSVLGSKMTEPVEGWLYRASERCGTLGLTDLARALKGHARAEAGHHLMMIADARSLADRRHVRGLPEVDVDRLLAQLTSEGVLRYIRVHEENLSSETPYAQVAIEYEVEMLPLRFGNAFVAHCLAVLGLEIAPCLSFVTEHIILDASHTDFNARLIARLLNTKPGSLPSLVDAGSAVLDAYGEFVEDCVKLARADTSILSLPPAPRESIRRFKSYVPPAAADTHGPIPDWLVSARELRASVFFEDGRRPRFKTEVGSFADDDPIDLHAHHILAYEGPTLVGCVRVYCLSDDGPACVAEQVLGEDVFSVLLAQQQVRRADTIEIGRWVVKRGHRENGRTAIRLAAIAAALAERICDSRVVPQSMVVCAVGLGDGQDLLLTRVGMKAATCAAPANSDDFNDDVRVMYCVGADCLNTSFRRLMGESAPSALSVEKDTAPETLENFSSLRFETSSH
jgi:hypothetical protein